MINEEIKDIIIKTIISFYSNFNNIVKNNSFQDLNLFEFLGFDILMTDNYKPKLLEVNTNPSPYMSNYLMKVIKTNVFLDTLNLIGIVPFSHKKEFKIFSQSHHFKNNVDFKINEAICEIARPKGDFELIFPSKENIGKFKKYFTHVDHLNLNFWERVSKWSNSR